MRYYLFLIFTIFCCGLNTITSTEITNSDQDLLAKSEAEKEAFVVILLKQLKEGLISADAGWEVYSNLINGELRDSMLTYINILSEFQKIDPSNRGYKISARGIFIRDCSTVLSVQREVLLKNFCSRLNDKNEEDVIIDLRKLFIGLHNGEVESLKGKRIK